MLFERALERVQKGMQARPPCFLLPFLLPPSFFLLFVGRGHVGLQESEEGLISSLFFILELRGTSIVKIASFLEPLRVRVTNRAFQACSRRKEAASRPLKRRQKEIKCRRRCQTTR
jgi:hypothetical protein